MKTFSADMSRNAVGVVKLPTLLAAMAVVSGKMTLNSEDELIHWEEDKILDWSFTLLEGRNRWRLNDDFWKKVEDRMEDAEMTVGIFQQLGLFVSRRSFCIRYEENNDETSIENTVIVRKFCTC